ncbi:glycosyltransferase family 2 protein [Pedobacter sp. UBA4863]|uniref:glycosyltransferase family 2 protein n=1 Tax=Pedobacter sp. UBA4863 TaxID=1947060 RepID=UPI0025ED87B4|nr:glycosyltransferase family 2 protein [Pedobacter sp. UBA4863]
MQTQPKISIVIPSFNQGAFIEETIQSVVLQGYPNLELIIIDGGSTDNSVEIIKKYETNIHYWISEKDNGQAHAINKGLKIATGELHSFLNSDDLLLPNVLFKMAKAYQKDKKQIITGNWFEGNDLKSAICREVTQPLTLENLILNIGLFGQPGTFWSATKKPMLLNESYHYCLDFELFYRLFTHQYEVTLIEKPVALFRQHAKAKTATLQILKHKEIVIFLENNINYHTNISAQMLKLKERNKRTLYRLELMETLQKQPLKLIAKVWEALKYDPRVFIKGI